MADVRPLPGIRYAVDVDLAALVTPPYDVISPEAQTRYYERDPHNIIRLELGRDEPGDDELHNRYTRAAATFAEWRLHGVMRQDAPALYLYEQRFSAAGKEYARLSLLARVRLEPWEASVVLPHERTLSKPKADRLQLMRACAANLSPIMSLYDDPRGELMGALASVCQTPPHIALTDEAGEEHRLWLLDDAETAARVREFFDARQLYIADGHHRYETALAYRDEMAALRKDALADDAANYTLMALSAIEDPGLLVLPTHRILRNLDPERVRALPETLGQYFDVEPVDAADAAALMFEVETGSRQGRSTFALVLPRQTLLLRLLPEGQAAMEQVTGEHATASAAWRRLDIAVLHELVLHQALGIDEDAVRSGEYVSYTRDAVEAIAAARDGAREVIGILVPPTPPAAIRDVARAGDRMPQKSTYFYPKLITGLVVNPLW